MFTADVLLSHHVHRLQVPLSVDLYLKSFLPNFQKVYVFVWLFVHSINALVCKFKTRSSSLHACSVYTSICWLISRSLQLIL